MSTEIKPVLHDGDLYDYTEGCYCGVLITKGVMKKIAKLQAEHLRKVKAVLLDEADEGNVFPSMWTLHYPEGKQTTVTFIDTSEDVRQRIKNATTSHQPRKKEKVFIAQSMGEAEVMADAFLKEQEKDNG